MTHTNSPLTLDDLIAFNGELTAVVRAGVPLDLGLAGDAGSKSRIARLSERLALQIQQGRSLSEAIADEKNVPPMYRAVVQAGVRAGRLPEALEGLSQFVLLLRKLRHQLTVTMLSPVVVMCLTYLAWLGFLRYFVPEVMRAYEAIRQPPSGFLVFLLDASSTMWTWCWIPPMLVAVTVGVLSGWAPMATSGSGNARESTTLLGSGWLGALAFLPGIRQLLQYSELATFSRLTGLLVAQQTPLPEALDLSAEVLGDRSLRNQTRKLIERVRQGASLGVGGGSAELPPYLNWLIQSGIQQGRLSQNLAEGAEHYSRKSDSLARWLQFVFPLVLVIAGCGSLLLVYCLTIFLPFRDLMLQLALP